MRSLLLFTALPLLAAITGCATFGTNIAGDFACRAGKEASSGCAPASQIDAAAISELGQAPGEPDPRPRAGVVPGDRARTAERMLRIVFPAHVDEAGTLHEEAVAWTVVRNPEWAATLRRKPGATGNSVARRIEAAQQAGKEAVALPEPPVPDTVPAPIDTNPFPLASPLVLPSTAREAIAGATAPAIEGFDMILPHDRTPRSTLSETPLVYPTVEALDAAKDGKEPK